MAICLFAVNCDSEVPKCKEDESISPFTGTCEEDVVYYVEN